MITREEYNKALDIVEEYHKQLFIGAVSGSFLDEPESTTAIRFKNWCGRNEEKIKLEKKGSIPVTTGELYYIWQKQAK